MIEDGVLHISEAAAQLSCTPQYLRILEWEGRILPVRRDFSGRIYTPFDISLLRSMGVGQRPRKLGRAEEVVAHQS